MTRASFVPCLGQGLSLVLAFAASAAEKGVINDPDGFTNLRKDQNANSEVVAKVKTGEVFEFESGEGSPWWRITLSSGKSGWMHSSRIRFHYTLDDIPDKGEEGSEVGHYGKARGFDYVVTARAAAKGEPAAMQRYFGINDTDGAAAETHAVFFSMVIHLLGDEKLAAFLKGQPLKYRLDLRNELISDFVLWPFEANSYAERNFPRTYQLLCRKEMVDWPSPDGRFAIRKVFSEAKVTENSRVTKAELIDKSSGKVLRDLSEDDSGRGPHREGNALWSPDSRYLAYFSGALGTGGQTTVYERKGDRFTRVDLPEVELPGRANDAELKGAEHLWQFVEPEAWQKPNVLVLLHHDYFEGQRSDRSISSMGRTYTITHDLGSGIAVAKVRTFGE